MMSLQAEKESSSDEKTIDVLLVQNKESSDSVEDEDNKKQPHSTNAVRYLMSASIGAGFFTMGFCLATFGLALPTLAANVNVGVKAVAPILVARGGGYLFGSLIIGLLETCWKADTHMLTIVALVFMMVGSVATPTILNIVSLYIATAILSTGMGSYETVANVLCLYLWGRKAEPVLQFLHFCYCFGGALSPFIARPFLNEAVHDVNHSEIVAENGTESSFVNVTYIEGTSIPYLSIPYFIFAGCIGLVVIFMIGLKTCSSYKSSKSKQQNTLSQEGSVFRNGMLGLLFLFYFFYVGVHACYSTFIYTFAVSDNGGLAFTKDVGASLSAVFYFASVGGQFCAIFMSKLFRPHVIIITDLTGVTLSVFLMLLFPFYFETYPVIFWIATGIFGVFVISIYGSTFLWAERYITVNGSAASIFIVGGSLGEMVLPLPVGQLIDSHPRTFLYFIAGLAIILILLFTLMSYVASRQGQRHSNAQASKSEVTSPRTSRNHSDEAKV